MHDSLNSTHGVDYIIFNSVNGDTGALNIAEIFHTTDDDGNTVTDTHIHWDVWTNDS